jgi:radical SAM protein with 4Fe4S-binding SPASM domain
MGNHAVYSVAPDVRYISRDEQHLFVNPELPDWLLLNTNGALLLSLFDGVRSLEDVIGIANGQGLASPLVHLMVSKALHHGILATRKEISYTTVQRNPRTLKTLLVKVTNNCNLSCDYCYAESGVGESLTSSDLAKLLEDINARFGPIRIELSGGEPLLNKNTIPFAKSAKSHGHAVALLTNGTVINRRNIDEIAQVFDLVQVSIDGADASGHDCHRGAGSHMKATVAADMLIEKGVNVQIGMTLNFGSKNSIEQMINRYGERLKIKPITAIGRGTKQIGALPPDEFYESVEPYFNSEAAGNPRRKTARFVQDQRRSGAKKCAIGDMHISISETGDVYPCHLIHDRRYLAGNIREQSLAEIYDHSPVLLDLERFSVDMMTPCSTCTVKRLCGGGCPAVALAESDRLDVAPSFCAQEKARFIDAIFDVENGILEQASNHAASKQSNQKKFFAPIFMRVSS